MLIILRADLSKRSQCSQYPCYRKQKQNERLEEAQGHYIPLLHPPIQLLYYCTPHTTTE
jgi:hypothetical protein